MKKGSGERPSTPRPGFPPTGPRNLAGRDAAVWDAAFVQTWASLFDKGFGQEDCRATAAEVADDVLDSWRRSL